MSDKSSSRELALQLLFQLEFHENLSIENTLSLYQSETPGTSGYISYAKEILEGVQVHGEAIDNAIQAVSKHWKVDRMARVDYHVMRIAIFEMDFNEPQLKPAIAIDEAIELAKKYGGSDSGSFVNGLLDEHQRAKV